MGRTSTFLAVVTLLALTGAARAETYLLKSGARIYGFLEPDAKGNPDTDWITVRTCYGRVSFRKREIRKTLTPSRDKQTLYVEEALVTHLDGTAYRSTDDGKSWQRIRLRVEKEETEIPDSLPIRIKAGTQVKTGAESKLALDVGWGVVQLDAESVLKLQDHEGATLRLDRGRIGVRAEELPKGRGFRVETAQASLGVTGTAFLVEAGEEETYLAVLDGSVQVRDRIVGAGRAVRLTRDRISELRELEARDRRFAEDLHLRITMPRIDWVQIPAGIYSMDRVPSEPPGRPRMFVKVAAFLLGRYEVTQAQYRHFAQWLARNGDEGLWPDGKPAGAEYRSGADLPVYGWEDESWHGDEVCAYGLCWTAATAFSRWVGGRLPTEAEWEFAAVAGGRASGNVHDHGWTAHNSGRADRVLTLPEMGNGAWDVVQGLGCRPHPVGQKLPSPYGLYDILGNAYEWVSEELPPDDGSESSRPRHVGKGMDIHCTRPDWSYWFAQRCVAPVGERLCGVRVARDLPR